MTQAPDDATLRRLIDHDRAGLIDALAALPGPRWQEPSLCSGWTIRDVVSHLLMPYEASTPLFLTAMVRHRFSFDRVAGWWVRRDRRDGAALTAALRQAAGRRFNVPGAGAAGELSHLVIHSEDLRRPLGAAVWCDDASQRVALDQLMQPAARGLAPPGLLDGVRLQATDIGWATGTGATAQGPAVALTAVLAGRAAALGDLTGDGATVLRDRFATSTQR